MCWVVVCCSLSLVGLSDGWTFVVTVDLCLWLCAFWFVGACGAFNPYYMLVVPAVLSCIFALVVDMCTLFLLFANGLVDK